MATLFKQRNTIVAAFPVSRIGKLCERDSNTTRMAQLVHSSARNVAIVGGVAVGRGGILRFVNCAKVDQGDLGIKRE